MRGGSWTAVFLLLMCGCAASQTVWAPVELKRFPLDSMEAIRAASGVSLDPATSTDGNGSLKIESVGSVVVPLFEVEDISVEDAVLIYQASVQTEALDGRAYLEMWVRVPDLGEYFSRGLDRPLTGTTSWATVATPFFLEAGQRPDRIRLNLVVDGAGTVWIDDVRLLAQER